jgi:hypothetical protein
MERLQDWKNIYQEQYQLIEITGHRTRRAMPVADEHRLAPNPSDRYFHIALRLFYRALEKIFVIERKRLIATEQTVEQIQQSFQ